MPEEYILQPLTREDRISVFLYRLGIGLTGLLMLFGALALYFNFGEVWPVIILSCLYLSVGLSVFNIHLYLGSLKRFLKGLYLLSIGFFLILLFIGRGNPWKPLFEMPFTVFFLLPLAGCIAFIGAKEAYCFRLLEGFIICLLLPFYILLWPFMSLDLRIYGLAINALLYLFLSLRKAVMPLSFDIGDKTKYVP